MNDYQGEVDMFYKFDVEASSAEEAPCTWCGSEEHRTGEHPALRDAVKKRS